MTEKVAKEPFAKSDDESPKFQSPEKLKDGNSQATLTTTVSAESDEYDTASEESGSGEYSDESGTEGEDDEQENEDGSIILDVERQSGDGQENDGENKKKVDDDEDRSNPQYIPKKGTFYEHDDRTAEDLDAEVEAVEEGEGGDEPTKSKEKEPKDAKPTRKWQASQDRWTHDRFEESEQAPKSRNELVSAYGYDIRSEDGPPKARRRRRYAKGPNKYTRNWEDEAAYTKQTQQRKPPRPEDFPALGTEKRQSKTSRHRNSDRQSSEYKENNDRNIERNEERRSHGDRREDRDNNREQRRNYKDNKAGGSTPNNRRSQNNQRNSNVRNDNYRSGQNTLEFINQNRNKASESQKDQISHRYVSEQPAKQQQQQQQQQQQLQNSNYHSHMNNVPSQQQQQAHYHQSNSNNLNENVHKEPVSYTNARLNNQRYQNENVEDNRYHQQSQMPPKDQRDTRQSTPISQQQLQSYVQMQAVQQQQQQQQQNVQQANIQQQQKVQHQLQQMSQVQAAVQNQSQAGDPSRTKRYSSLRQRTGMENVSQNQTATIPVQQTPSNQQMMQQDQSNMMSEAAILQQLQQNEKLKQIQSTLAHQKQISYHQAITPQAQPPQANQALPLQNTSAPQYPPPAYYAQTAPEYQPAAVQQATPVQTQQPQMIANPQNASAQYAQYAPQNTPSYIQNAYLPQQPGPVPAQPPPQMYVPSIQQTAPQTQFQPQYSGYTPNFTPQATTNQTTPIYQSQPPPSITYFTPTATNPPPTRVTRRPTNAIPILAPPERSGNGNSKRNEYDTGDKMTSDNKQQMQQASAVGSAENIDHILDNMFVRRPPLQPAPMMKSTSPSIDVAVADSVKNLSIKDDSKDEKQQIGTGTAEKVG